MALYLYKAKTFGGELVEGEQEAKDEHELARKLKEEGFFLLRVSTRGQKKNPVGNFFFSFLNRVPLKQKMIFAKNLASMLKASLPLSKSLSVLLRQTKKSPLKKIIESLGYDIKQGVSFSRALSRHRDVFGDFFLSMAEVGENAGNLDKSLALAAQQMQRSYELKSKVVSAMIYPSIIVALLIAVGLILLTFFVPKLAQTFEELEVALPPLTAFIVWLGDIFSRYYIFVIGGIAFFVVFARYYFFKTEPGRKIISWITINTPGIRSVSQKYNGARFSRTLSTLVNGGVPIGKSLEVGAKTLNNYYFSQSLLAVKLKVQKGGNLSESLNDFPKLYGPMIVQMVEVGEQTGALGSILEDLAIFYEEDVFNITNNLSSFIEPVVMVVVAVAVGIFAIAMIYPLYSVLSAF